MRNWFTGERLVINGADATIATAALFRHFPVAVMIAE
jgi:hypothetical protein